MISASYNVGRDTYFDGWIVLRVNADGKELATDKDAAWYHYKRKWFGSAGDNDRGKAALAKAQAWVAGQGWCSGPWTRNRMHDYVPAAINKAFPIPKRKDA
jgi:hypothetical protein